MKADEPPAVQRWPLAGDQRLVIGVLADTHVNPGGHRQIPDPVLQFLRRRHCDLILHAGDANCGKVLEGLRAIAPVIAVCGNNDDHELQDTLPRRLGLEVGSRRLLMLHGDGGISARSEATRAVREGIHLVVYGHSHIPITETVGNAVVFNPGSPTDRRAGPHFGIGLITVQEDLMEPELILFADPRALDRIE